MSLDWLARGAGVDGQTLRSGVAELKNKAVAFGGRLVGGKSSRKHNTHTVTHSYRISRLIFC